MVLQQPLDENHDPVLVSCEPPKIELEETDVPAEASEEAEVETEVNEETDSESNETQET